MARPKLDPSQFAPAIAPYMMETLTERVAALGIAPERLCVGLGFGPRELRDGLLVSNRQAWRMIRRALQLTRRPDLGMLVGSGQDLSDFGQLGLAMVTARDFAEACDLGVRYYPQGGALADIDVAHDAGGVALIVQPRLRDPSVVMFLAEEFFTSVVDLIRSQLGYGFAPVTMELTYPAPAHAEQYRERFGSAPRFNAARNSMTIASHWLAQPMPGHDPAIAAQVQAQLAEHAAKETVDTVASIERVLMQSGQGAQSITEVALALDLSVRTLRRRLSEAGTTFRALSDRVLARTAQRLLREEGLTVAETGERLGFSEVRAFRRAFKRWTGHTPGELRYGGEG